MNTISVTRPDSRVNLGATDSDHARAVRSIGDPTLPTDIPVTITVTLSEAEALAITGPGDIDDAERDRLVTQFVTDWLSPSIAELGDELANRRQSRMCRRCGGALIGTEISAGSCGDCGDRWEVRS